jgi:peptidoglycan hydrolase-like protein with peptidoglycan-binding domain
MENKARLVAAGGAVLAAPLIGALTAGNAVAAVAPAPKPPTKTLPARLDVMTPYQAQVSCDPTDKPGVRAFGDLMLATYRTGSYGVSRYCQGDVSEHYDGRALDWMLSASNPTQKALADSVVTWLSANDGEMARRFGIMYIIWNDKMWREYRPQQGWAPYTGSDPHTSHIHFSFTWDGAMKRTSWWTGVPVTVVDQGPCRVYAGQYAPLYTTRNTTPCPVTLPAAPGSVYSVFVQGQSNPDIAAAQRLLGVTADGAFGPATFRAVAAWQARNGVPVTGALDKATWAKLAPGARKPTPAPAPAPPPVPTPAGSYPLFRQGQSSPTIAIAQKALGVTADGAFGPLTFKALVSWQASHGVPVTGVLDKATWAKLVPSSPSPSPTPPLPAPPSNTQAGSAYPAVGQVATSATTYTAYKGTVLRVGSHGAAVKVLQRALGGLAVDGAFGARTRTVLLSWQKAQRLPATGVADRGVWNRLEQRDYPLLAYRNTVLRKGSTGPAVVALQKALRITADGRFGVLTEAAVKSAQRGANLARTGVVAALTWQAIEASMRR